MKWYNKFYITTNLIYKNRLFNQLSDKSKEKY